MGTLYRNGIPYVGSGGAGGVEVTQAEYDALPTSEKMNGSIYFITDGSVSYPTASQMRYDNTESGIPSTSVQGAIDELKIEIGDTDISSIGDGTLSGAVSELNNSLTQFITYRNVQKNVTIPASGIIYDQTLDIPTVSGYKAFAIGGWHSQGGGYADSPFTKLNLNETAQRIEYAMMTRNAAETSLTIKIKVLYIRSNWVNIPV